MPRLGVVVVLHVGVASVCGVLVRPSAPSLVQRDGPTPAADDARITPPLEPLSHKTFFNKDYPHDGRPKSPRKLAFGHPYPIVQDSGEYDKDFVKDENADRGEWKAQEDYDRMRVHVEKAKRRAEQSSAADLKLRKEAEKAAKAEAIAEREAKKAEAEAEAAAHKQKEAQAEVDELIGKEGGDHEGGKIGEQVKVVNEEIMDFAECQKRLKDVQAKLKALQDEQNARKLAIEELMNKTGAARDEAAAAYDAARHAEYTKVSEDLLKQIRAQKGVYNKALAEYQMSEEEVKKTDAELDVYAEKLRQLRAKEDPQGGISYTPRSAGKHVFPETALAAAMCVVISVAMIL